MTVRELIDELESYDENMEVMFSYDSRDYWGTTICRTPTEIGEANVEWSDYHSTYKYVDESDDYNDDEDEEESDDSNDSNTVVLLS